MAQASVRVVTVMSERLVSKHPPVVRNARAEFLASGSLSRALAPADVAFNVIFDVSLFLLSRETLSAFFICFLFVPQIFAAPRCGDRFRDLLRTVPIYTTGQSIRLSEFPDADATVLGSGAGGYVYRIMPHDGSKSFVYKHYLSGGVEMYEQDIKALRVLKMATEELADEKQARPVEFLGRIGDRGVKLEYVPGSDFKRLAEAAGNAEKARLGRLFRRQIESLKRQIEDKPTVKIDGKIYRLFSSKIDTDPKRGVMDGFPELIVNFESIGADGKKTGESLVIYVKPNNVVLAPDGRVRIVDPL